MGQSAKKPLQTWDAWTDMEMLKDLLHPPEAEASRLSFKPSEKDIVLLEYALERGPKSLSFPHPWERAFRREYALDSVIQTRIVGVIGIAIYILYGFRDAALMPDQLAALWTIRFGIVSPILFLMFASTFVDRVKPYVLPMMALGLISLCFGNLAISSLTPVPQNFTSELGLMAPIIFAATVSRLRFWSALGVCIAIFLAFQTKAAVTGTWQPLVIEGMTVYVHQVITVTLFTCIFVALLASYVLEYRARVAFLQNAMLDIQRAEMLAKNKELHELSTTDGLTGLYNRRYIMGRLDEEWKRCKRSQDSIGVVLLDIDFFKPFNDNYGHQAGDDVLEKVGAALQTVTQRGGEIAARYGGEEFILMFPNHTLTDIQKVANRINQVIRDLKIPHKFSLVADHVTCSVGAVAVIPRARLDYEMAIEKCDELLYECKEGGRDRFAAIEM